MMNVKLRPAPTLVNAILGCPFKMVRKWVLHPYICFVNKWNRFQDNASEKVGVVKLCAWGRCRSGYVAKWDVTLLPMMF